MYLFALIQAESSQAPHSPHTVALLFALQTFIHFKAELYPHDLSHSPAHTEYTKKVSAQLLTQTWALSFTDVVLMMDPKSSESVGIVVEWKLGTLIRLKVFFCFFCGQR